MKAIILSSLLVSSLCCFSQLKPDTLIDKSTSIKYILDSSHKCVTAFDSTGKQLWMADAWHCKPWMIDNDQTK